MKQRILFCVLADFQRFYTRNPQQNYNDLPRINYCWSHTLIHYLCSSLAKVSENPQKYTISIG